QNKKFYLILDVPDGSKNGSSLVWLWKTQVRYEVTAIKWFEIRSVAGSKLNFDRTVLPTLDLLVKSLANLSPMIDCIIFVRRIVRTRIRRGRKERYLSILPLRVSGPIAAPVTGCTQIQFRKTNVRKIDKQWTS